MGRGKRETTLVPVAIYDSPVRSGVVFLQICQINGSPLGRTDFVGRRPETSEAEVRTPHLQPEAAACSTTSFQRSLRQRSMVAMGVMMRGRGTARISLLETVHHGLKADERSHPKRSCLF